MIAGGSPYMAGDNAILADGVGRNMDGYRIVDLSQMISGPIARSWMLRHPSQPSPCPGK